MPKKGRRNMGDAAWLNDPGEEEVEEKEHMEGMARMGIKPEALALPEDQEAYRKFLETYKPED